MQIKKQISRFMWEEDGMATPRFFGSLIGVSAVLGTIVIVGLLMMVLT